MVRRVAQVSGDCWERPPVAASLRSIAALVTHPWVAGRLAARWPTGSRGAVGRPGLRPRRRYPAARATTMGPRSLSGHTSHARSNRSGETRTTRRSGPACRAGLPGQVSTAGPPINPQAGRPRRHPRAVPASSACRSQPRGIPSPRSPARVTTPTDAAGEPQLNAQAPLPAGSRYLAVQLLGRERRPGRPPESGTIERSRAPADIPGLTPNRAAGPPGAPGGRARRGSRPATRRRRRARARPAGRPRAR